MTASAGKASLIGIAGGFFLWAIIYLFGAAWREGQGNLQHATADSLVSVPMLIVGILLSIVILKWED